MVDTADVSKNVSESPETHQNYVVLPLLGMSQHKLKTLYKVINKIEDIYTGGKVVLSHDGGVSTDLRTLHDHHAVCT